jgi:hypothetical protein
LVGFGGGADGKIDHGIDLGHERSGYHLSNQPVPLHIECQFPLDERGMFGLQLFR